MSDFDRTKWDAKYAAGDAPRQPSAVLVGLASRLPVRGRALDLAGGAGRNGIWLAQRGLEVTIADVSCTGLAIARQRAAQQGIAIETAQVDLEGHQVPGGPWDLILSICYLYRPLFGLYPRLLASNGLLVVIQPTLRNLERHEKPPAEFLLKEGELRRLVEPLEVLSYEEDWFADDRHDAVVVARNYAA